ncbi:hypothetical protein GO613_09310 [Azoarcus communis]|uniref:HK97 gp10 family phage protein n=1 Tax=Parazoarcus communis TaxID=41977 RepID=UPI001459F937|nr:HK97 gp10 family phage protein [Parazoarcus communis]NMG48297.1 hypothetical protein [Parazoarcus communis]
MIRVDFDAHDVELLAAAMQAAPEVVLEELQPFMYAATLHMQSEVQDRTPTTHGTLRASIIGDVRVLPGFAIEGVVGTSLAYAVPVELGSAPHMPPIEPLVEWAKQKLGVRGKEAESAAWGVARAIAQRGTLGVGMFNRALAANRRELLEQFSSAVRRIANRIGIQR